jgi:hypothetical protein
MVNNDNVLCYSHVICYCKLLGGNKMLTHTQVRKPVVPTSHTSHAPDFFERNKGFTPFAWISLSDEVKPAVAPPLKKK